MQMSVNEEDPEIAADATWLLSLEKVGNKSFPCPIEGCKGHYRSVPDLRRHINDCHLQCKTWKCPDCGAIATQLGNAVRHIENCIPEDPEASPILCSDARWPLLQEWKPGVDLPVLNDDGTAYMPDVPPSKLVPSGSGRWNGHSRKPYERRQKVQRAEQPAVPVVLPPVSTAAANTAQTDGGQLRQYRLVSHIDNRTGRRVWQFKDYFDAPQPQTLNMITPTITSSRSYTPTGADSMSQVASTSRSQSGPSVLAQWQPPAASTFDIMQFMAAHQIPLPNQECTLQGNELEMAQIRACLKAMAPPAASQSHLAASVSPPMQMPFVQNQQLDFDLNTFAASLNSPKLQAQAQVPEIQVHQPLSPQHLPQSIALPVPPTAAQDPAPFDWDAAFSELLSTESSPADSLLSTPNSPKQPSQQFWLPEMPVTSAGGW